MYLNVTPVGVLLYFVSIILLSDMQIKHQVHIQGYAPATSLMEIQKKVPTIFQCNNSDDQQQRRPLTNINGNKDVNTMAVNRQPGGCVSAASVSEQYGLTRGTPA